MGTNYYHHRAAPCATCGHEEPPRHIGKSSAGWAFALHVYPDDGIHDLPDWLARFERGVIRNEYGETVTPDEMLRRITKRGPEPLRHDTVDRYCIKRGDGTWDCIVGEFS